MSWLLFVMVVTLLLAYANGANDNFKGVATLFGSGTTNFRWALYWATLCTFLGSIAAMFFATKLVKTFSGKGLVSDGVLGEPVFIVAVILGAGLTVLLAARLGIPISTTHSLTGALVGSGVMAIGNQLQYHALGKNFLIPLLVSPFIAIAVTSIVYLILHKLREWLNITKSTCVCVEETASNQMLGRPSSEGVLNATGGASIQVLVDDQAVCAQQAKLVYDGQMFGFQVQKGLDTLHFLSAGAVSFARGLNDTPKIVALCVVAGVLGMKWHVGMVGMAMAMGGLLSAKRVAETIAHKITSMNHGQGLSANLVTASLVLLASHLGVPVSTTHVSCGALFGIGLVGGHARWNVVSGIVCAWVLTLPIAAGLAAISHWGLTQIGV